MVVALTLLFTLFPIQSFAGAPSLYTQPCSNPQVTYMHGAIYESSNNANVDFVRAYLDFYLDGYFLGSSMDTKYKTTASVTQAAALTASCYHNALGLYEMDWSTRIHYKTAGAADYTDTGYSSKTKSAQ